DEMATRRTLTFRRGAIGAALVLLGSTTLLGACARRSVAVPAASPATTTTVMVTTPAAQRVVSYPSGRYELYGDGVTTAYYWVWIPAGATLPALPPPPPLVR